MMSEAVTQGRRTVRVGIVDSGVPTLASARVAGSAAFVLEDEVCVQRAATTDVLGHGSSVAACVLAQAPEAELWCAQVFHQRLTTTALQVAQAIDWLVAQQVEVINLSLGLRNDRAVLAAACERACAAGVIVCAASPARGAPVYPAAYPGVWRVTGDARCALDQWSWLATGQADYGAHVAAPAGSEQGAGASLGCAHLSGHVARILAQPAAPGGVARAAHVHAVLQAGAHFRGPERRLA